MLVGRRIEPNLYRLCLLMRELHSFTNIIFKWPFMNFLPLYIVIQINIFKIQIIIYYVFLFRIWVSAEI